MDSLTLIQNFYGDTDLARVARAVKGTPRYQLIEIADRLIDCSRFPDFGVLRPLCADRTPPYVHDVLTSDWESGRLQFDREYFKHLLLYCDILAAPDLAVRWAHEVASGYSQNFGEEVVADNLAAILHQMRTVAPLVESGKIRLFPAFDSLGFDTGSPRVKTVGWTGRADDEYTYLNSDYVLSSELNSLLDLASTEDDLEAFMLDYYQKRGGVHFRDTWDYDLSESEPNIVELDRDTLGDSTFLELESTWYSHPFLSGLIVEERRSRFATLDRLQQESLSAGDF